MKSFSLQRFAAALPLVLGTIVLAGCPQPFDAGTDNGLENGEPTPPPEPPPSQAFISLEVYEAGVLYTVIDEESNFLSVRGDEASMSGVVTGVAGGETTEIHLNAEGDLSVVSTEEYVVTIAERTGTALTVELMTEGTTYTISDVPIPEGMPTGADPAASPNTRSITVEDPADLPHHVRAVDALFEAKDIVDYAGDVVENVGSSGLSGFLRKQAGTSMITVAATTVGREIDEYVFDGEYTVFEELGGQTKTIVDTIACAAGSGAACVEAAYEGAKNIWEGYKALRDAWDSNDLEELVFGLPSAAFVIASGNDQLGIVNKEFAEPLSIELVDEHGASVAGAGIALQDTRTGEDWVYITDGTGRIEHSWTAHEHEGPQHLRVRYAGTNYNVLSVLASGEAWDADDPLEFVDDDQLRLVLEDLLANDPPEFDLIDALGGYDYNAFEVLHGPDLDVSGAYVDETPHIELQLPYLITDYASAPYPFWAFAGAPSVLRVSTSTAEYEYVPFIEEPFEERIEFPVPITVAVDLNLSSVSYSSTNSNSVTHGLALSDAWAPAPGEALSGVEYEPDRPYLVPHGTYVETGVDPDGNSYEDRYTYAYGRRHGPAWRHRNGVLVYEGAFANNVLHGEATSYFPSTGTIEHQVTFVNGAADGEWRIYSRSGELESCGQYDNGSYVGPCE